MLNHHRRGRGESLVLVHGIGSQWQIWQPVIDLLASERDVVAVDLPGFGGSRMLAGSQPTVPALARAVREFCLEELGWQSAHVGGFSLGGGIALELARSGFAQSALAIAPVGFHSQPELAYTRAVLQSGRVLSRALAPRSGSVAGRAAMRAGLVGFMANPFAMPADAVREGLASLAHSPGWDATLAHGICWRWPGGAPPSVPITIAWGMLDLVLPVTQARRAERALPAARHVRLRRRGHVPTWEASEDIADLLLSS